MRKPKLGKVYILQANLKNGKIVYKYGASTSSIKARCYWSNKKFYNVFGIKLKFKEIFSVESSDVFNSENLFNWFILDNLDKIECTASEFFTLNGNFGINSVKDVMRSLCKVG